MTYEIDLSSVYNPDDLHEVIGDTLPLPDYYGGNLDALHDVLTDFFEDTEITFTNVFEASVMMPKYIAALKRMCGDAEEENPHLTIRFKE